MAKKPTKSKVAEKISAEELEQLQLLQKTMANAVNNLANIEIAKYELLNEHAALKVKMQEFSLQLQEKYGEVNVSLADGSISEIPSQEPVMAPVE
jgi:hypothetical protein